MAKKDACYHKGKKQDIKYFHQHMLAELLQSVEKLVLKIGVINQRKNNGSYVKTAKGAAS